MDEIHKVVKTSVWCACRLVVGVDAIKAINDIFVIWTQTLSVGLSEATLSFVAGPKESEEPADSSLITHIIAPLGFFLLITSFLPVASSLSQTHNQIFNDIWLQTTCCGGRCPTGPRWPWFSCGSGDSAPRACEVGVGVTLAYMCWCVGSNQSLTLGPTHIQGFMALWKPLSLSVHRYPSISCNVSNKTLLRVKNDT